MDTKLVRVSPRGIRPLILASAVVAVLNACGAVKEQAAGVFLHQNQVSSALMQAIIAAEVSDPDLADQLYDHEEALQLACGPLQKAGFRNFNDELVDDSLKFEAFNALGACRKKSGELALFLWQVDPVTAEGYLSNVVAEDPPTPPRDVLSPPHKLSR